MTVDTRTAGAATDRLAAEHRRTGVHIALSPTEHAVLAAVAERLGCSRSETVRRALRLLETVTGHAATPGV